MEKRIAQFSATIDNINAKKDNTLSIRLGTQELSAQDAAELFEFRNCQIWVAFAETSIVKEDLNIPDEIVEFPNEKSLSERLRNILFIYWQQKWQIKYPDFEVFRKIYMEKYIAKIKEKLDD